MRTTNWGGAIVLAWALLLAGCMGDSGSPQAASPTVTNPNEEEPDTPVDPEDPDDSGDGGAGGDGNTPLFPKDPVVRTEPAGTGAAPRDNNEHSGYSSSLVCASFVVLEQTQTRHPPASHL